MSTVITVENLGKKYTISHQQREEYSSLREVITNGVKSLSKKLLSPFTLHPSPFTASEDFWALKDVSFEVNQGDRIGIIGRNGAGKSTLLKILSRITEPTTGSIRIKGRVASLLEVGTGFHPELTGRENIYLNGAILGMHRDEIRRKFDEIVDFAEVERFLDTPVKRYSSGMYVRLAFAVAAHLEPEILIVDEVLAVGDMQFQKKCLGKMEDVSVKEGRTVLFVSHNMGVITELCNKGILLGEGEILFQGDMHKTVASYNGIFSESEMSVENCARRGGSGGIRINRAWISNSLNQNINTIVSSDALNLHMEAVVNDEYQCNKTVVIGFGIDSLGGQRLLTCVSSWVNKDIQTYGNILAVKCSLPSIPLVKGKYLISVSVSHYGETLDYVEHCGCLEIEAKDTSFSRGRDAGHGHIDIPYVFEVSGDHDFRLEQPMQ